MDNMDNIVDRSTDRAMAYFKANLQFQKDLRARQRAFLKNDIAGTTNDAPKNVYPQARVFSGGTYLNFGDNLTQRIINKESVCQVAKLDKSCKRKKPY